MSDAKKKFILFLKKKGAYAAFRKNLNSTRVRNNIKGGYILSFIVSISFTWNDTKEGYDFWRNISDEWHLFANNNMNH